MYQSILGLLDVIRLRKASLMIAIVEGILRLGESLFLEVGMFTTGSLPLMKRGALCRPSS